ncbi:hypothetical protein [Thiocapsa marina]|nr:hypothetical protein [Thiocapsa marina]
MQGTSAPPARSAADIVVKGAHESEVRSAVLENGPLFPVAMTDSSIPEIEPADGASPTVTVLGEAVHTTDPEALQEAILTPLFDRYAAEHGIEAEPAEIDTFVEHLRQGLAAEGLTAEEGLTPEETAEIDGMRRDVARAIIRQWKINKALHAQYGGRIIYQQLGPEPLDAYREFLQQRRAEGAFRIQDPALAEGFWRYFTDESIHDFMTPGGADAARAFKVPPWEDTP